MVCQRNGERSGEEYVMSYDHTTTFCCAVRPEPVKAVVCMARSPLRVIVMKLAKSFGRAASAATPYLPFHHAELLAELQTQTFLTQL